MKTPKNEFLAAIRAGRKQLGYWTTLANPLAAEIVASTGFDWVVVDQEHAPAENMTTLGQLQAVAGHTNAIVRPAWHDAAQVKKLMDMGAPGLMFPMINTVSEAESAVAAVRYPPHGVRGLMGTMRGSLFGRYSDYLTAIDTQTAVIIQIETLAALDSVEDLAAVDGVDGVFFGPADISADMGLLGQTNHPDVWDAIWTAARKLIAKDVPIGTIVLDPEEAAALLNKGFTFVACGTDIDLFARSLDDAHAQARKKLKREH